MTRTSSSICILLRGVALCLAAGASTLHAEAKQEPIKGMGKGYQITVSQEIGTSQRIEFRLEKHAVDTVDEDGRLYSRLDCQGGVRSKRKGFAELPFFHATLQLSDAQKCRVVIEEESHEDVVLDHPMLPSKGVIYRNEDPRTIERAIARESLKGGWFPATIAKVTEPFIFRDVRGVNVYLHPFQYDAATRTLRVTTRMVVRMEPEGEALAREFVTPRKPVAEMDQVYRSLFLNAPAANVERWSHEVGEVGDILVICTARDASAIAPYVQWKREKGHKVKVVQVATGTTVKTTIQQEYAANPGLLYVQLVGDWADIKSDLGTRQSKPMDPVLGYVAGNDAYAELIIGRFSASTAEQVTVQVNKAINYEKYPDASGTWYKKGLVIGSDEGPGDDDEGDVQHETYIRNERLLRTTYSSVASALGDSSTRSMISTPVNAGLSVINYTGHGSISSWVTTGFNNSDVSALTNGNKLPVICSVACVTGSFTDTCFAEAWLRNPNGGAAAGMFSTIDQPWEPPMRGQDYFNDLLTGGYNYATRPGDGISTTYGRSTFGSLAVNAAVLMYAESSQGDDLDTIRTWTTFGDASLQVRTDTPKAIVLSNETVTSGSTFSTRVTAGGVGVSNALISLSRDEQVFSGLTDANGNITLNHALSVGAAKLVVTGQNTTTIYRDINVGVTVNISPSATTMVPNVYQLFKATVSGTTNRAVTWTCTGGTISASGNFQAPWVSATRTYKVRATSVADTSQYAEATVTVNPSIVSTYTEVESNNSTSVANEVPDTTTKITGTMSATTDLDFFQINVAAGRTVTVNMTGPSGSDYDLHLLNSAGTVLKRSEGSTCTESVTYQNTGTITATYFIKVTRDSGSSSTNTYNLTLLR